jgi:hypothetical protein
LAGRPELSRGLASAGRAQNAEKRTVGTTHRVARVGAGRPGDRDACGPQHDPAVDLRGRDQTLSDPLLSRHLKLTSTVAGVVNSALPFVADTDDPAALLTASRDATAPAIYRQAGPHTTFRGCSQIATSFRRRPARTRARGHDQLAPDPGAGLEPLGRDVVSHSLLGAVGRR